MDGSSGGSAPRNASSRSRNSPLSARLPIGDSWNSSGPHLLPRPALAGAMKSRTAICASRNAALASRPAPSEPRSQASQTLAGALTTKRKPSGTCAA
ncbi:hypothetical protein D3C81_1634580 [compost metagenome]